MLVNLLATVSVLLVVFWLTYESNLVSEHLQVIESISLKTKQLSILEKELLLDATINEAFYINPGETIVKEYNDLCLAIKQKLTASESFFEDKLLLSSIDSNLNTRAAFFNELVAKVLERGFKGYGTEGQMRELAHLIEERAIAEDRQEVMVLMLRRHEKDFLIRKENIYIERFNAEFSNFESHIELTYPNDSLKATYSTLLRNYRSKFLRIVELEYEIGHTSRTGLRQRLAQEAALFDKSINNVRKMAIDKSLNAQRNIRIAIITIFLITLANNLFLGWLLNKNVARPVQVLSVIIHEFVKSRFSKVIQPDIMREDEVGRLSKDFLYMQKHISDSFLELSAQSEQIAKTQKELYDSMRYAQTIQEAILPDNDDFALLFSEYFAIYKPKNLVSGDFYWVYRRKKRSFWAVGDCTGHGVPGALMSMISLSLLNKIVGQNKIYEPAAILEMLHDELRSALHQEQNKNNDGLELALCCAEWHTENEFKIQFAGAKSNLIYFVEGVPTKLRGTKRTIGGKRSRSHDKVFENQTFIVPPQSTFYLYSDGIADQHNEENKKLGSYGLLELIQQYATLDIPTQHAELSAAIEAYIGNQTQRDDITLLSVRLY